MADQPTGTMEAPVTIEPTTASTVKPLAPGLQAIFDKQFMRPDAAPADVEVPAGDIDQPPAETGEPGETAEPAAELEEVETPPAAPEKPEKKPAKKAKPEKSIMEQLAPDFTAPPGEEGEPQPIEGSQVAKDMPETPPAWMKSDQQKKSYKIWRINQIKLERELADARAARKPSDELTAVNEDLRKENERLSAAMERTDLYNSPKFQRDYVQPRDKAFAKAMDIVKHAGGDPERLRKAMGMQGDERQDVLDELSENIQSRMQRDNFRQLIVEIDERTADISDRLTRSREEAAELRKQELIERHQKGEKSVTELKNILAAKMSEIASSDFEFAKRSDKPGFEWWNEDLDKADKVCEHLLIHATPEDAALGSFLASRAPLIYKAWKAERKARIAADTELAAYRNSNANHGPERGGKKPAPAKQGTSFQEGVMSQLKGGG